MNWLLTRCDGALVLGRADRILNLRPLDPQAYGGDRGNCSRKLSRLPNFPSKVADGRRRSSLLTTRLTITVPWRSVLTTTDRGDLGPMPISRPVASARTRHACRGR